MPRAALAALLIASLGLASPAIALQWTDPVQVEGGAVVGVKQAELAMFKGIPFAAPPVRDLRWKAPQPVPPWKDTLVADRYAPMCLQPLRAKNSVFYEGEEPTGEDCLYLNVWTPKTAPNAKLPVMVFVYGGGWVVGSGSMPLYSGESLAKKGVVVVTLNYRLGALGFFAHPALTAESGRGASGNYGLMDMIAALKWVRANIERFGGDPSSVTVYGQSAGAMAISMLETSPEAKGLFERAIGESGGYATDGPLPTLADVERKGLALGEKLKASNLEALRNLGGDAILAADNNFRPNVDGFVLPRQPAEVYAAGQETPVSLLAGSNADEATPYPVVKSAAAFAEAARKRYGDAAEKLLELYPAPNDAAAVKASYELFRDQTFAAPVRAWALAQSRLAPVYLYRFNHTPPFVDGLSYAQQSPAAKLGAYHGAEMAYAYGTMDALNLNGVARAWTDADRKLSEILSTYWVNFAKTGDPNGDASPKWATYNATREDAMLFGETIQLGALPDRDRLDFFIGR